jgi:hypothetical protein
MLSRLLATYEEARSKKTKTSVYFFNQPNTASIVISRFVS